MKVEDLVSHLEKINPNLEVCCCDINGDIEPVEGALDREKTAYLVRESKPWSGGEDYYEYWTLHPRALEVLEEKKIFIIW